MVQFSAKINKFQEKGDKTGWTYVEVPAELAAKLSPQNRKSFRVKGRLDRFAIKAVALLPMGGGSFILPLNATMRKGIGKKVGAMLELKLEVDQSVYPLNAALMDCLADEPDALAFFNTFNRGTQHYYSKWVEAAKTEATRTRRIAMAVNALLRKMEFGEMLRANRKSKEE